MSRALRLPGAIAALWLASGLPAEAHVVAARLGDFYAGALHPLTDLQEMVLWLALAVLAGAMRDQRGRWLALVFPLGLLAGLYVGIRFDLSRLMPFADAALMIALGLAIAAAVRLPAGVLAAGGFAIAVLRGAAGAAGATPQTDLLVYGAGLALAGYAVVLLATAGTYGFLVARGRAAGPWRHVALRACGSWIAAIGLMLGSFALAT